MGRKRILNVSLDDKTLTGIVDGLSKRLNRRDELEGIPRIYRGGIVQSVTLNQVSATFPEARLQPILPGVQNRCIQLLGYALTFESGMEPRVPWLVETSQDFTADAIILASSAILRPEVIIAENPTSAEASKFVRTLGKAWSQEFVQWIPFSSQVGLLSPGHGVGLMIAIGVAVDMRIQGVLHYRELPANIN